MNSAQADLMLAELRQMRQLLELMAEPAIAQRDARLRDALRGIVGSSAKKQQCVMLMDGTRTQAQIVAHTSVSKAHISTMVGRLKSAGLLSGEKKQLKLAITIPSHFFDANPDAKRR